MHTHALPIPPPISPHAHTHTCCARQPEINTVETHPSNMHTEAITVVQGVRAILRPTCDLSKQSSGCTGGVGPGTALRSPFSSSTI
eukprot:380594-Pelagomonas_calceolata.AAC.1